MIFLIHAICKFQIILFLDHVISLRLPKAKDLHDALPKKEQ